MKSYKTIINECIIIIIMMAFSSVRAGVRPDVRLRASDFQHTNQLPFCLGASMSSPSEKKDSQSSHKKEVTERHKRTPVDNHDGHAHEMRQVMSSKNVSSTTRIKTEPLPTGSIT